MANVAIFASGAGSNAENLIRYFTHSPNIHVCVVLSNNSKALVLERVTRFDIPTCVFNKNDFYESEKVLNVLREYNITHIVLAGFLWLVPQNLLHAFPHHIVNIHPALLPHYGGKGMYGMHVHEAVVKNKEVETGITIHTADAEYDRGEILFQACCEVHVTDTPETVAAKVHTLEYEYFPQVVEKWVKGERYKVKGGKV